MKKITGMPTLAVVIALILAACAPATTVQPEQIVVAKPFAEAFSIVSRTISTQPYPSDKGGWVVMNSDQVGGLILAEMNYVVHNWWTGARTNYVERVSVAFNVINDNRTGINVSLSGGDEAESLATAIIRDLQR